jgi:hypothetical protein
VIGGRDVVDMLGLGLIFREKVLVLVPPTLSVTLKVKLKVPALAGVPINDPLPEIVNHVGNVPPASAKV